jgi:hypothetical protein
VYYFLFYCVVCLFVNVWSVENESFEEFPKEKDFEDFEQQRESVDSKSLLHSCLSYTTFILHHLFI